MGFWAWRVFLGYSATMPLARVVINLGGLNVKVEQESSYPDMVTDLCNRASVLFGTALAQAKASEVDILSSTWVDYGDDEEEDD